ncbi:DUF2786 domain-containing protein [Nocardioides sp. AE5]|uniref:DUF2786 domain-containing protein n=1 Tax=Nocardioides sp. AE5 TaxID=2962573 RepID=UPI002880C50C|nr:DUF2786 domain-containing protein [Nocardioides sp. AE5]MDT0203659.1 DUF2786 domain-containing protein [Nocardioides sp. AE5]
MNTHPVGADAPILAKIRKLLAKAEDQAATRQEAETYTAKAAQLIADYGIDAALLAAAVPGADVVGDRIVVLERPFGKDKAELLADVATRLRCRAVLRTERTSEGKVYAVHLFGHESDLVRTDLLFTSLLLQATGLLARTPVPPGEHKAAFRRSWLAGFRVAIVRRLAATEADATRSADAGSAPGARSATLVLADRSRAVTEAMHDAYPRLGTARQRSLSGSGMPGGYAAGQRADLGETRLSGQRRALGRARARA